MIMKKKVLAMLMSSVMVFSLTACGGSAETVAEETQQEEIVDVSFSINSYPLYSL